MNQVRHHNNALTVMRAFNDREMVVTGDLSGDIMMWSLRAGPAEKPNVLSRPGQAVRCLEPGPQGSCYVALSTSVIRVVLKPESFQVADTFDVPGAAGAAGSISGLQVLDSTLWIAGSRSIWVTSPALVLEKEIVLSKATKVLALLNIKIDAQSSCLPCTLSVMSELELWDAEQRRVVRTFVDSETERTQGKAGVLISCAVNLSQDAILVARNNQIVVWTLKK